MNRSKRLKSEKAKVKLKTKTVRSNDVTNTSFKIKKILIRQQCDGILSSRESSIDDLLMRFRHPTVREDALKQLKAILLRNHSSLHSQFTFDSLLHGVAALSLDKNKDVRATSFHALHLILDFMSNRRLTPSHQILTSYLNCAMTHIDPGVKRDSLLFLDVLVQNCNSILVQNSHKILLNFLTMLCGSHDRVKPRLTTILCSKSTDVKWRIRVLKRLANLFISIINYTRSYSDTSKTTKYIRYVPVYSITPFCEINFHAINIRGKESLCIEEFVKCITLLMPLMFDIWLEVCPDEIHMEITIEAAALLKNIIVIMQSIIEYIDMLDHDDRNVQCMKHWFKDTFLNAYMKNFLSRFPYDKIKPFINYRKNFSQIEFKEECLEHNLGICQIYVWFTSLFSYNEQFPKSVEIYCISIVKYLNDIIENWCDSSSILSQLTKLLRTLFLKASPIWHSNSINLNHTLKLIIEVFFHSSKKEVQSHLCLIIGDIMLKNNLNELHREEVFKNFVMILPSLLLRPSIDDIVIRMISQIVLRFNEWIREELIAKREYIIENAKKIDIVGTHDDKRSRLMICNLFYFVDSQVYY